LKDASGHRTRPPEEPFSYSKLSITTQKHLNVAGSGGKIREVNKVRKEDENCVEKPKQQPNFYAIEGKDRSVFFSTKPMILLMCKKSDTVQPCDTTRKVRFGLWLKICTIQSYVVDCNSKSNRWIKLKLYQKIPEVLFYVVVLIQMNKCLGRTCDIG